MKVVALAGGVGGAKLVYGIAEILPPEAFSIIVNTGDDFEYLSLKISPDLDTVCYTLANLANPETGWGQKDETWQTFDAVVNLDGPAWFRLGDKDLATHLLRTTRLKAGEKLSDITIDLLRCWGVDHFVYPMSDDPIRTIVHTQSGEALDFQEYFVHQSCLPEVRSFEFFGIEQARPVSKAVDAIKDSDLIIFSPSNPWVSIDPILAVPGIRELIETKPVIMVSPLVRGKALKGPAAKMYTELGIEPCALEVAKHYRDLLAGFVVDSQDAGELEKIERWRIIPFVSDIVMKNRQDRARLAEEVLNFGEEILSRSR